MIAVAAVACKLRLNFHWMHLFQYGVTVLVRLFGCEHCASVGARESTLAVQLVPMTPFILSDVIDPLGKTKQNPTNLASFAAQLQGASLAICPEPSPESGYDMVSPVQSPASALLATQRRPLLPHIGVNSRVVILSG